VKSHTLVRIAVSIFCVAFAGLFAPVGATAATCTRSALEVPSCGVLWGVYSSSTSITTLESQVGRQFDIVYHFHTFDTSSEFPNASEVTLAASGHVLLDDWTAKLNGKQLSWAAISNGTYNSEIDAEATKLKSYGKPVMLSFEHEADLTTHIPSQGTAAQYAAAYRYIHNRFASDGVKNVIWVWTTTGYGGHDATIQALYPGSAYVDWVGYDPYNFAACHDESWKTFSDTVSPFYNWLESNGFGNKPFILPEYGTVPGTGSEAAQWFNSIPSVLQAYPNIKALLEFDDTSSGPGAVSTCNSVLTAASGEFAAFTAAGHSAAVVG
jgi:glycosyl hydrolase family 26